MGSKAEEKNVTDLVIQLEKSLIVFNDEVNTFDHVIDTFMEVLDYNHVQAEQCATIIHNKGKYDVKHGSFNDLEPFCTAILERGISAEVQ